jgi:hypothetical protein
VTCYLNFQNYFSIEKGDVVFMVESTIIGQAAPEIEGVDEEPQISQCSLL